MNFLNLDVSKSLKSLWDFLTSIGSFQGLLAEALEVILFPQRLALTYSTTFKRLWQVFFTSFFVFLVICIQRTVFLPVISSFLTGIFLIAELTGGYDLFLPLMMVSVSSYLTIMVFEPHSIYSMRLAKKGELLTHHKDKAVLTLMNIESVVETDFEKVRPDMDLGEMVKVISQAKRNLFPVVDVNGELLGIVALDDIRNIMFRQELYHRFKVEKFMVSPAARIYVNDSMEEVMRKFDDTKAWNLPVIDELGKYKGFVSKSKIFNSYRQVLVDFSAD